MLTDIVWGSVSTGKLVAIALIWVTAFATLAIAYAKTKRWDQAWKERWEHRHATSLETLRWKIHRTLKATLVVRWIALALFFMSVGFGLGPIVTAVKGLHQEPVIVVIGFAILNVLVLLFLVLVAVSVWLLKYRLQRINELLGVGSRE